jgi:16S rRNA (cytosine1402-N4)-methyltransferase
MAYAHIPVMLREVLEYLAPQPGQYFLDGTLGGAGYTLALAKLVGSQGRILSLDLDSLALANAQELLVQSDLHNVSLVQENFKNLVAVVEQYFPQQKFAGVVLDLGLSSAQLADPERGFSFKDARPLDMSFGPGNDASTLEIVNNYPLLELTRIFREYGEEKRAYQLAKAIVEARRQQPLASTADLVRVVESSVPRRFWTKIHPATRIFQALRMETNDELGALRTVLPAALSILQPGGRLVVVSFHSGEDRIVKRFLRATPDIEILTKRPLIPQDSEITANPRSRSAKLRAAALIK